MYRIVFNPAIEPMNIDEFCREYSSLETATAVLEAIADYTLMLHDKSLMVDYSNYGGIEEWDGQDWVEVE